ncbi:MAG: hypothetical protein R6U95_07305 [Bacteroidales bacterium]
MKILAIETLFEHCMSENTYKQIFFSYYPDSSIIRNNEDFYIPNFDSHIRAYAGIYIKISKIGKCIEAQFSHRYFSEIGVAINFIAQNTLAKLQSLSASTDIARGFDKSFAASNTTISKEFLLSHSTKELTIAHTHTIHSYTLTPEDFEHIGTLLSQLSQYITLKIGDFFFIPFMQIPDSIKISDSFTVKLGTKKLLSCRIQ